MLATSTEEFFGLLKPPESWNYEFVHYGVLTFDHAQTHVLITVGCAMLFWLRFLVRIYVRDSCKQFCDP